jgi:hypothetical protein
VDRILGLDVITIRLILQLTKINRWLANSLKNQIKLHFTLAVLSSKRTVSLILGLDSMQFRRVFTNQKLLTKKRAKLCLVSTLCSKTVPFRRRSRGTTSTIQTAMNSRRARTRLRIWGTPTKRMRRTRSFGPNPKSSRGWQFSSKSETENRRKRGRGSKRRSKG